jgi:RNA polymerase sigma factor (sigma-70 family)
VDCRDPDSSLAPHYEELRRYFRKRVSSQHEADDLTQEAYVRVFGRKKSDAIKEPIRLLYRIARNLLIDRSRRAQTRPKMASFDQETEIAQATPSPAMMAQVQDELAILRAAVANLPERCQEVFILSRFEGLSYAEIATRLGITVKTVENHMGRAILACRAALEKE